MADASESVRILRRQQAAIANFGSFAIRERDPMKVMTEAARVCAEGLGVRFCKVCQYRPEENDLLVVAGWGWKPGVIGNVVSRADKSSPQGRAFMTGEPSIIKDLSKDTTFTPPAFYVDHGIVSTVDVIIKGENEPYGVLEIDSEVRQDHDQHDIDFLTAYAPMSCLTPSLPRCVSPARKPAPNVSPAARNDSEAWLSRRQTF
jgi:hypothetical protein